MEKDPKRRQRTVTAGQALVERELRRRVERVPTISFERDGLGESDIIAPGGHIYRPVEDRVEIPCGPIIPNPTSPVPVMVMPQQPVVAPTPPQSVCYEPVNSRSADHVRAGRHINNQSDTLWFFIGVILLLVGFGLALYLSL